LAADDELGYVYAADESQAVRKYYADPDLKKNEQIVTFGTGDGFQGDREGIGIYKCMDGTGYLLVSSQGNKSVKIYRREGEKGNPHKHLLLTTVFTTGAEETDGLEVTSLPAGPIFPKGFLAKHNSKGRNFVLYAWEEVAQNFLKICVDANGEALSNRAK
jgi:3-phytase